MSIGYISRTWKRAQTVNFTIPYLRIPLLLMVQSTDDAKVIHGKIERMNNANVTIGVLSNSVFSDFASDKLPKAHKVNFRYRGELLEALQEKKVNAIIVDGDLLKEFYREHPEQIIAFTPIPIENYFDPIAIPVSYNNPKLHAWLNVILDTLVHTKTIQRDHDQYFPKGDLT